MRIDNCLFFDVRCEEAFKFHAGRAWRRNPDDDALVGQARSVGERRRGKRQYHARAPAGGRRDPHEIGQPPGFSEKPGAFHTALAVDAPAEAERIFAALAEGGTTTAPMSETFFERRFGMVVDRFGMS